MDEFAKENRYLVLKNKDIQSYLTKTEQEILATLARKIEQYRNRPQLICVVVESDWQPEYEQTWELIKTRVKHHIGE